MRAAGAQDGGTRRGGRVPLAAAVAAGALVLAPVLSGCSGTSTASPSAPATTGTAATGTGATTGAPVSAQPVDLQVGTAAQPSAAATGGATTTPSASASPAPSSTASPASTAGSAGPAPVAAGSALVVRSSDAEVTGVQVAAEATSDDSTPPAVTGSTSADGHSWTSARPTVPSTRYTVRVTLDRDGTSTTRTSTLTTAAAEERLTTAIAPLTASTVGIAMPIDVRFSAAVTDRAAVQRALRVTASTDTGPGSWHWFSSTHVQYRPKSFWPAGAKVVLHADLAGVTGAPGVIGTKDRTIDFTIGRALNSTVDGSTHTMTVKDGDRVLRTVPISAGKAGYRTWQGILVTTEKEADIQMNSDSVGIFGPEAYDLGVKWAVRVTNSGTFVHAAPWNHELGKANTSHGCINMSTADAQWFFGLAQRGDPVTVVNTGGETVKATNGYSSWNIPWARWTAGSAL